MAAHVVSEKPDKSSRHKAKPRSSSRWSAGRLFRMGVPLLALLGFVGLWELVVRLGNYPPFILPGPLLVAERFVEVLLSGVLLRHTLVTLAEVIGGLVLGISAASLLGYMLAKSITIERALSPYIVASQAIPIVAIAPLLVIWFGSGLFSKVLISALIVFFPVLVNTVAGLRSVPVDLYDLMRTLQATRWQVFTKLELPAALPVLLTGLKVGATLSVIGAIVGEFAGANAGLGFMIAIADGQYDTAWMFVGVFMLIVMALALYGLVSLLERITLRWQHAADES